MIKVPHNGYRNFARVERQPPTEVFKKGCMLRSLTPAEVIAMREYRHPCEQFEIEAGYTAATGVALDPDVFTEFDARELGLDVCFA